MNRRTISFLSLVLLLSFVGGTVYGMKKKDLSDSNCGSETSDSDSDSKGEDTIVIDPYEEKKKFNSYPNSILENAAIQVTGFELLKKCVDHFKLFDKNGVPYKVIDQLTESSRTNGVVKVGQKLGKKYGGLTYFDGQSNTAFTLVHVGLNTASNIGLVQSIMRKTVDKVPGNQYLKKGLNVLGSLVGASWLEYYFPMIKVLP